MDEKDLPKFEHQELKKEVIEEFGLELIDDKNEYKIYGSVIDIDNHSNEKLKKKYKIVSDNDIPQVLLTLAFRTEMRFRADSKIIQIEVVSIGKFSNLNDVKPL